MDVVKVTFNIFIQHILYDTVFNIIVYLPWPGYNGTEDERMTWCDMISCLNSDKIMLSEHTWTLLQCKICKYDVTMNDIMWYNVIIVITTLTICIPDVHLVCIVMWASQ